MQCQITGEYDQILSHELDYLDTKHIPTYLHNDNVYLTIAYKCALGSKRRISLAIRIEQTLYRTNFAVFRRHWYCHGSSHVRIGYVRIRLHRSLAYTSDEESNLKSWPSEHGRLYLMMYSHEQPNEQEIIRKVEYNVRFLPVHQRPSIRSFSWQPWKRIDTQCPRESGKTFLCPAQYR
jgi:hypothetical protein